MTTYPLSEPATVYAVEAGDDGKLDVVGHGTLEECVDIFADLPTDRQKLLSIHMDTLDLKFGPREVSELQAFLREETAGLSNSDITEIRTSDI